MAFLDNPGDSLPGPLTASYSGIPQGTDWNPLRPYLSANTQSHMGYSMESRRRDSQQLSPISILTYIPVDLISDFRSDST